MQFLLEYFFLITDLINPKKMIAKIFNQDAFGSHQKIHGLSHVI